MTSGAATSLQQRLSEQLEALSQVGELLTLRLLELEERLEGLEHHISTLQPGAEVETDDTGALLAATAERITRLEDLLTGGSAMVAHAAADTPAETPALQVVHDPDPAAAEHEPGDQEPGEAGIEAEQTGFEEPELELHPFPDEEEEQPFMDELSA